MGVGCSGVAARDDAILGTDEAIGSRRGGRLIQVYIKPQNDRPSLQTKLHAGGALVMETTTRSDYSFSKHIDNAIGTEPGLVGFTLLRGAGYGASPRGDGAPCARPALST